jgi:2-polyprenyl-3-methyl-5-hydroxy-6-metoxy-1,4-benzoquinol methylase
MTAANQHFVHRDRCPGCQSEDLTALYQNPYDADPIRDYLARFYGGLDTVEFEYLKGAYYLLVECAKCRLIFQQVIPDDFLLKRLYEHWVNTEGTLARHRTELRVAHYGWWAREILQILAFLGVETPSSANFFDYGMGWGRWALMAKAYGCNSYGLELSETCVEYAKANGIVPVSWEQIPSHRFDFINTEQVFEHLADPLGTLRHLRQALKPQGVLKISVPAAPDIMRRLKTMDWMAPKGTRNSLNPVAPLEHVNFFRRKSLTTMASTAGMKEVFIPLHQQYLHTVWMGRRRVGANLRTPICRNILKSHNYVLLRNTE